MDAKNSCFEIKVAQFIVFSNILKILKQFEGLLPIYVCRFYGSLKYRLFLTVKFGFSVLVWVKYAGNTFQLVVFPLSIWHRCVKDLNLTTNRYNSGKDGRELMNRIKTCLLNFIFTLNSVKSPILFCFFPSLRNLIYLQYGFCSASILFQHPCSNVLPTGTFTNHCWEWLVD